MNNFLVIAVFYLTTLSFSNDTKLFAKNTASIKAHGLQVELSPASTSSGDIIYFTTYDGKSSTPLIDSSAFGYVLSEEFKPLSFGSSTFVADYGSLNSYGQIADYGAVSLAMPTTDSDSNGIPDWLQIDMSVNANVSGSYALHYNETGFYPSDSTLTGKFTRSSENINGNYSITFFIGGSDSYTYSGVWHIDYHYGTVQYDDDSYSINTQTLNSDGRLDQVIGSYKYSNSSTDSLNLGKINLIDPDGIVQLKEGLLQRTGNSYSGYAKAVDGYAVTSWADYLDFYVEIVDTNDGDRDGIPDFTDPVKPFLYTAGSDLSLGWRSLDWFGAYFPFSSGWIFHSEHGWIYSQSGSLVSFWFWHPAYNWCWTNENVYPWVWFHNKQIWKYFFKSSGEWVTEPDTAKPKLDLLGGSALKLEAGQIWKEPGATAYDERDGDITVNINIIGKVDMNTPNTYTLKYSVADAAGNQANVTRIITVLDTSKPVLKLRGDENLNLIEDTHWTDPGASAIDSLDGNLTAFIKVNGTLDMNTTGAYQLIYTVSDAAGNESNASRTVNVRKGHAVDLNASVKLNMFWVDPGTYTMGSPTTDMHKRYDENEHNVTLTQGFYLGRYEVTQAQYEAVMTGNTDGLSATPSHRPNNPNRPVESVSWSDAHVFLTRLNAQQSANIPAGWAYVLPTESQWEYACRAGTTTMYSWGDDINSSRANYNWDGGGTSGNDFKQTRDVGQYAANPWGFFDMHGNVWEWTADWYQAAYPTVNPVVDPTGLETERAVPSFGKYPKPAVARGGSWYSRGSELRSANRESYSVYPYSSRSSLGFRVSYQKVKPPKLDLLEGETITREAGHAWVEPGVVASDERALKYWVGSNGTIDLGEKYSNSFHGNLTSSVIINGTVDMNRTGTYFLNYSVVDAAGNETHKTRTIRVEDTTPPLLSVLGDTNSVHMKDSVWVDPGATASDSHDGELTSSVSVFGNIDVNATGTTYRLTYRVSDEAGNEANASRMVTVGHIVDLNASVKMEMLWVQPGTFIMGSPTTEVGRRDNETEHNVTITKGFYLGRYEVTQAQYKAVMTGNTNGLNPSPSKFKNKPNSPVDNVSMNDIQVFLARLNSSQGVKLPSGWTYALPTEAQWEYACRAGTTTMYSWGDDINATRANYSSSGLSQTRDVGYYSANPWGFYDMHGNVSEWIADFYQANYPSDLIVDPIGPRSSSHRVTRGGSWSRSLTHLRSAARYDHNLEDPPKYDFGFRIVFLMDYTNPFLKLNGHENMFHVKGTSWTDPGATANDSLDGNLTESIAVKGVIDINTSGAYPLTYTVSDEAGNETNAYRTVNIREGHTVDLNASVKLEMFWVEPGTFTMGSPLSEQGRYSSENEKQVTLTEGFYLGKYEVTQAQYEAIMTGNSEGLSASPSRFSNNPNRPVETVSWDDIQVFLGYLNERDSNNIPSGWTYALPTEAQWEYACRAGTTTMYSWGDDINATRANYSSSGLSQTRDVGYYSANPWGFYDMHGNVSEWTADFYQDPAYRVARGGSWQTNVLELRSASKSPMQQWRPYYDGILGFRVVFQSRK